MEWNEWVEFDSTIVLPQAEQQLGYYSFDIPVILVVK